jgi:hypothetical protein
MVNFTARNSPECVGLSCRILAAQLRTNSHSLFDSFDEALKQIDDGTGNELEPVPHIFRLFGRLVMIEKDPSVIIRQPAV